MIVHSHWQSNIRCCTWSRYLKSPVTIIQRHCLARQAWFTSPNPVVTASPWVTCASSWGVPRHKSAKYLKQIKAIEFNNCPTRCDLFSLLHFCRQLYMFRVLTPITRSSYNCNYSFWYWLTGSTTIRSRCWVGCQHPKHVELPTEI